MATQPVFQIDKGFPPPKKAGSYVKRPKPPVELMEVGDSMLVAAKKGMGATNKLNLTARSLSLPYRFTSAPEGEGTFRVWRIA